MIADSVTIVRTALASSLFEASRLFWLWVTRFLGLARYPARSMTNPPSMELKRVRLRAKQIASRPVLVYTWHRYASWFHNAVRHGEFFGERASNQSERRQDLWIGSRQTLQLVDERDPFHGKPFSTGSSIRSDVSNANKLMKGMDAAGIAGARLRRHSRRQ